MTSYFFDSSSIVKRYVTEVGSFWVNSVVAPTAANEIFLGNISGVEVVSAITRRQRNGSILAADAAAALAQFRTDLTHLFRIIELTPALILHAMILAETHALRAYDAVQLATALAVHVQSQALGLSLTLISADAALNVAASSEGLMVDDPNSHP